jgi:hypothetical protein
MKHIVWLSGGKDSTALALRLHELNPAVDYIYAISPTGDELPDMVEHWIRLSGLLEKQLTPVTSGQSLGGLIGRQNCLPNARMRFCTRILKIEPAIRFMENAAPAIAYVGLRADEETRVGAVYADSILGIAQRFPLREWGWGVEEVMTYLDEQGIRIPDRTDCAMCYAQQLGEWWNLWKFQPERWKQAEEYEQAIGHTFRTDTRDAWPAALKDLRARFENGAVPTRSKSAKYQQPLFPDLGFTGKKCRVCSL